MGALPGKGTPFLQVKEQLLPARSGVVQLKVPPLSPVMRELGGGLEHPGSKHNPYCSQSKGRVGTDGILGVHRNY